MQFRVNMANLLCPDLHALTYTFCYLLGYLLVAQDDAAKRNTLAHLFHKFFCCHSTQPGKAVVCLQAIQDLPGLPLGIFYSIDCFLVLLELTRMFFEDRC